MDDFNDKLTKVLEEAEYFNDKINQKLDEDKISTENFKF